MTRLTLCLWMVLVMVSASACGGRGRVVRHADDPAPKVEVAPEALADPFDTWPGAKVPGDAPFKISRDPVGSEGCRVIVTLKRVKWSTFELPSGEESRSGTVTVSVKRGDEIREVHIDEGSAKTVHDCRLSVETAGEDYAEEVLRWEPWVQLTAIPAS